MRMLTKSLLILLIPSLCMGAQIIRYVDTDEATGTQDGTSWATAYDCLLDAIVNEAQDLTDAGGDYLTIYCKASSGTVDVNTITLNGYTTGSANYIEVIGFDFPADGIYDATKYVLHNNDSATAAIDIKEDYVRFHNIQFLVTETSTNTRHAIYVSAVGTSDIRFDSCTFKGVCSGTGSSYALYCGDTSGAGSMYNCIAYGFVSGADTDFAGIYFNFGIFNLYNCTVYGCYKGIVDVSGTINMYNCISGTNTSDDITGNNTIDYCCTDDGAGTNVVAPASLDWDNELADANNGDFRLVVSGNCYDGGTDNPGSGLYSDDVVGDSRTSAWSVGAYEFGVGGPANGQVIPAIMVKADIEPDICLDLPSGDEQRRLCNYIYTCGEFDVSGIEWTVR